MQPSSPWHSSILRSQSGRCLKTMATRVSTLLRSSSTRSTWFSRIKKSSSSESRSTKLLQSSSRSNKKMTASTLPKTSCRSDLRWRKIKVISKRILGPSSLSQPSQCCMKNSVRSKIFSCITSPKLGSASVRSTLFEKSKQRKTPCLIQFRRRMRGSLKKSNSRRPSLTRAVYKHKKTLKRSGIWRPPWMKLS